MEASPRDEDRGASRSDDLIDKLPGPNESRATRKNTDEFDAACRAIRSYGFGLSLLYSAPIETVIRKELCNNLTNHQCEQFSQKRVLRISPLGLFLSQVLYRSESSFIGSLAFTLGQDWLTPILSTSSYYLLMCWDASWETGKSPISPTARQIPSRILLEEREATETTHKWGLRSRFCLPMWQRLKWIWFGKWESLAILVAMTAIPGHSSLDLKFQYSTERYGWAFPGPFAKVNPISPPLKLNSLHAIAAHMGRICLLSSEHSGVSAWPKPELQQTTNSAVRLDKRGLTWGGITSNFSGLESIVIQGWLVCQVGLVLEILGAAYPIACRSLLAYVVGEDDHRRMHLTASAASLVGETIWRVTIPKIWHTPLGLGSWGLGLPFLLLAAYFGIAMALISTVTASE
ncbi:hypothetical protein BX600DRAFT_438046 [Xylariales sp. PMI_506]|nr:hypothetical protein BX600DRAFT_438046 [Xylariales sp. PMI_506]